MRSFRGSRRVRCPAPRCRSGARVRCRLCCRSLAPPPLWCIWCISQLIVPGVVKLCPGLNATTHAVFGGAALAGAALLAGTDPPAYAYPVAVAAAWLPDVDNPRSTLGNGLSRL